VQSRVPERSLLLWLPWAVPAVLRVLVPAEVLVPAWAAVSDSAAPAVPVPAAEVPVPEESAAVLPVPLLLLLRNVHRT